jgi:hypothetical protein
VLIIVLDLQPGCFAVNPADFLPYPGIKCLDETNGGGNTITITEAETVKVQYFVVEVANPSQCNGIYAAFESSLGLFPSHDAHSGVRHEFTTYIYYSLQATYRLRHMLQASRLSCPTDLPHSPFVASSSPPASNKRGTGES